MNCIGNRIKQLRQSLNMSQKLFSLAINISQGTLSDIERGKFNPSMETVISISNKFNVSTDWLLKGGWQGININKELEYKVAEAFDELFLPALGEICEKFNLSVEFVYYVFGKIVSNVYNHNFETNQYDLYHIFELLGEEDKKEIVEIAKVKYHKKLQRARLKKNENINH